MEVEAQIQAAAAAAEGHYNMGHATRDTQVDHNRGQVEAAVGVVGEVGMGDQTLGDGKEVAAEEHRKGEGFEHIQGQLAVEEAGKQETGVEQHWWRLQGRLVEKLILESDVAHLKGNYSPLNFYYP